MIVQQEPYKLKRGDSYTSTCYYETSEDTTVFGGGGNEEMCVVFIYYYPRQVDWNLCYVKNYQDGLCRASYSSIGLERDSNFDRPVTSDGTPSDNKLDVQKSSSDWIIVVVALISVATVLCICIRFYFIKLREPNKLMIINANMDAVNRSDDVISEHSNTGTNSPPIEVEPRQGILTKVARFIARHPHLIMLGTIGIILFNCMLCFIVGDFELSTETSKGELFMKLKSPFLVSIEIISLVIFCLSNLRPFFIDQLLRLGNTRYQNKFARGTSTYDPCIFLGTLQ